MKIDLHCHCKYSKRPTLWIMQKLGCPESFTEPLELYAICKQRGMDAVTITDHNVIDGALEIAHLPDTIIGCEYTTYFPENRCKVHVLVYGQTEAQHREISDIRENIFDFTQYVREQKLPHICAHPLFWINDRLTVDHIEQLILLYKNWELNADMNPALNDATAKIVRNLTPELIDALSNKHGFEPGYPNPWKKNLTTGSDDHSSLNLTSGYTEVEDAEDFGDFWAGLEQDRAKMVFNSGTPKQYARNIYGIGFQFYQEKFGLERFAQKDVFVNFLNRTMRTHSAAFVRVPWYHKARTRRKIAKSETLSDLTLIQFARKQAEQMIMSDKKLMSIVDGSADSGQSLDDVWYEFVKALSNKVLTDFGEHILKQLQNGRIMDLFHAVGSSGALYLLLAPYFISFSLHRKERDWSAEVLDHFGLKPDGHRGVNDKRVVHFTDTLYDVNGVARTLQQQAETAHELGLEYTVFTCQANPENRLKNIHHFKPVGQFEVPDYPELQLPAPPFLQILNHIYQGNYTHVHISTPGPMGLAGLAAARILNLPVSATYHTAFPEFGKALTDDMYVEEVLWKAMIWFYNQMDRIFVPSKAFAKDLLDRGAKPEKITVYPRGCDIERFHPSKRDRAALTVRGIPETAPVFLYVGRISKEKNLHVLAEAWRSLKDKAPEAHIVFAGDGPYRKELEDGLRGLDATFTGYIQGEELAQLYASCDCLVFPSTTDTFGNVVLEAQAAGIPVIVTDKGGPRENMLNNETGFMVPADDAAVMAEAMQRLAGDPSLRTRMGQAGRIYMGDRDFDSAFRSLYDMYTADWSNDSSEENDSITKKFLESTLKSAVV